MPRLQSIVVGQVKKADPLVLICRSFLAQIGAQGVKMSCMWPCVWDTMLAHDGSRRALKRARRQVGKHAGKHLEDIQSEPCPVGACFMYFRG